MASGCPYHGPDDRQFIHHPRHARHKLADLDTGHVGSDRAELTTNFRRRLGLEIEHVLVWRPSRQEDHDDRLFRESARLSLRSQDLWEGQPPQAQRSNPQKVAPGYPVTKPSLSFAEECYHGCGLFWKVT